MRIQLWSYNYDPEPTGIAPLSTVLAKEMLRRGHVMTVVAAHPHYPEPVWGSARRPYTELRDGVKVVRLPLRVGRDTLGARVKQEASFSAVLTMAAPLLGTPDVLVAVSPSFPALLPAMANARARRIPWVLWLQDILPDGAAATGLLEEGRIVRVARRLEHAAYRDAARVVVISDSFVENLLGKDVPRSKIERIYNPASRFDQARPVGSDEQDDATVLTMGNIGHTQNLEAFTRAFERSHELERLGAKLVMAGDGVVGDEVRAVITTDRARVTGVLHTDDLERELRRATVGLVSQTYEGIDFNVPSKLMNFMAYGLPVVASVRDDSEVARILRASGGGWVTSPSDLDTGMATIASVLQDPRERAARGAAARRFAEENFTPGRFADDFEQVLEQVVSAGRARPS